MVEKLFTPLTAGAIALRNRVVMAPLTRDRAMDNIPGPLQVEYYRQRAGAGLIVSEGTPISPMGRGYADTPGICSREQIEGWKRVTEAVHAAGGRMVVQLWHVGRVSHPLLLGGAQPVAPSAGAAQARTFVAGEFRPTAEARALEPAEVLATIEDFRRAAANAMEAGFDGVELHGANGYLIEQFLRDSTNRRGDEWGGTVANRLRFLERVVGAVCAEIGAGRTGIRLSPWSESNGTGLDSDPSGLFAAVIDLLDAAGIAFVHMIEGQTGGARQWPPGGIEGLRARFRGAWIANNGYDRAMAIDAVARGAADAVAFGKPFIANPDLVERLRRNLPLAVADRATFYGGDARGYTDYPPLA